jgi:reactive intermediate/imine deaminase
VEEGAMRLVAPTLLGSILALGACSRPPPETPTLKSTPQPVVAAPPLEHINLSDKASLPFSSAVRIGDLVFASGQIGTSMEDGPPKVVPGGIEVETRQALENMKAVLAKSRSSLDRVVSCNVMLADMSEWPAMNKVYVTFFPGPKPARAAWGATGLALGARVEISCIASADGTR